MWPYPWTHVGTPSHLGHVDRLAATLPSQAHAGAAQEAPDIGQWKGQDVPLVRPSSCFVKGGIPSSRRYLPTYLSSLNTICIIAQHGCWPLLYLFFWLVSLRLSCSVISIFLQHMVVSQEGNMIFRLSIKFRIYIVKKVPTRTGPCCAPSACYPCRFAPDQRLHLSESRVPNPKI